MTLLVPGDWKAKAVMASCRAPTMPMTLGVASQRLHAYTQAQRAGSAAADRGEDARMRTQTAAVAKTLHGQRSAGRAFVQAQEWGRT